VIGLNSAVSSSARDGPVHRVRQRRHAMAQGPQPGQDQQHGEHESEQLFLDGRDADRHQLLGAVQPR
jgi:hypothetical protein